MTEVIATDEDSSRQLNENGPGSQKAATEGHMNERDFFNEKQETKRATYSCPHCRERSEYEVRSLTRTKKSALPRNANEMDRAQFAKSRDYMVRVDDLLVCKNCRKRFDIPTMQSVVFI